MAGSLYYLYYFRPSSFDYMVGQIKHHFAYCLKTDPFSFTISEYAQVDKSHTVFTFRIFTDNTLSSELSKTNIKVACDADTLNNVYYDYTIIKGVAKGKCIEFHYSNKELNRECKSNGEWEEISNNMNCALQTIPKIAISASNLSLSFIDDKTKIKLNGKIKLTDISNCPANHFEYITYFYSLTDTYNQLPEIGDKYMKYKRIPYCFNGSEISFDFEVENDVITMDKLIISIYGNENRLYHISSVTYSLKCNENRNYNAFWPNGFVGIVKGVCNILHIWDNNNNPSRLDYPNRRCDGNGIWEDLSDIGVGCKKFTPTINFDYNEIYSFFDSKNDTIINGKLYVNYITECHIINETLPSLFYLKVWSDFTNEREYPINSCLFSNRSFIDLGYFKGSKLYTKLCYDKICNFILKDTEMRIYSCPSIVENNIHYKQTISGEHVNITSKDCSYFYSYNNNNNNGNNSFIRKCDSLIGWENSNEVCSPVVTDFRFDLSDITATLDNNDIILLNGNIKIIDGNECNYPSKPNSLFIIYDISSSFSSLNPSSITGRSEIIPYCFENKQFHTITLPLNYLKSRNKNDFTLHVKLCTSKTQCTDVNELSYVSKAFGCSSSTRNNYIFTSSLIGNKEGRCMDFYEYTETPPIIGKCNDNGMWEYPSGECKLHTYINSMIDIDLSNLTASIIDSNNNKQLVVSGDVVLTDKYGCNSTYKPNELRIEYALVHYPIHNYGNSETINTKYCFTNNVFVIHLDKYYGNNKDGVNFNIKVYTKDGSVTLGTNTRVFGCKPLIKNNIIWPVSLFGNVTGECIPLYEFEPREEIPSRQCLKENGDWDNYNKRCIENSDFIINTTTLTTYVDPYQMTAIRNKIEIEDRNKGNATYQPNKLAFIYYYSDSKGSLKMLDKQVIKNYPFNNVNHIENIDFTSSHYIADYETCDKLNMKLCWKEDTNYVYATKSQILVCKKINTERIYWKKTVVNTESIGECIQFYYYPQDVNHILPPRLCKEEGIWDNYNYDCVLMPFPKFDVDIIDISSTNLSATNIKNYRLNFKTKLTLKEHQNIPNYGQITLFCKIDNEMGENSEFKKCSDIDYRNETNIDVATYITNTININNPNVNQDNYYLHLKLCINTKEQNNICKYQLQDMNKYYLKCQSSSSSNATWNDSIVNSNVTGKCKTKYIYNSDGREPLRNCTINNKWDEPEDICIKQTNPTFSYSWDDFKSSDLTDKKVNFEGTLVVNDDSNCLKYQEYIYYRYCFKNKGNNCDDGFKVGKNTPYCFNNNKLRINIPNNSVNLPYYYFYIEFCTNENCANTIDDEFGFVENEIISRYNKSIICIREDLSDTEYNMVWNNTLPNTLARTYCPLNPDVTYYNGVDQYPERKCDKFGEWEPLIYRCVDPDHYCKEEDLTVNFFPISPDPRVYHSPCEPGYHNLIPKGNLFHNKARRNCTNNGTWSEIEFPCFSDDYKNLQLDFGQVIIIPNKTTNEFCVSGSVKIKYDENIVRHKDIYFMNIQVNYSLNNDVTNIYEFKFDLSKETRIANLSSFCFNNTNKIDFFFYYDEEKNAYNNKTLIAGCLSRSEKRNNFDTSLVGTGIKGYCDEGYISESVDGKPVSECKSNGKWGEIVEKYKCFYPNFRYYYLNLNDIQIHVNETHFILTNQIYIENNVTCDTINKEVYMLIKINLSPSENSILFLNPTKFSCVMGKIAQISIENQIEIKSTVINSISFGLFYGYESINNATRILGCPNYIYKHNIFSTSLFGRQIGKCENEYISQSHTGLPSNICNENGKWSDNIEYPCFKPTYKQTKFNLTELKVKPTDDNNEFCLSGKIFTEYYEDKCGDVDTPFNLTIYYQFKNLDTIYNYLDSFIYHCQKRISQTIYNTPVCVPSNITNEITFQLRYNDEIITTSSYILGCNRDSIYHNNFNTSIVGLVEGSCDEDYVSESINKRPIRECKADGTWGEIKYQCFSTDYKYLLFDSSKSLILIKAKTNFCLTNVLRVIYNRTICNDDVYHITPINIMFQFANETVNNTINTNALHHFGDFLFKCKYGIISEHQYPIEFCISSKTSTFIKFVMMYKEEVITSHDIYLGCDELKDEDNHFDTSLVGKNVGKCNTGYISLSPDGNPERECLSDGKWSEVTYPCIKDDYSTLRFNLENVVITLNNKQQFCINGELLSKYEGKCDKYNYNLIIKLYYQLNGVGVENYYQDFIFDCRNGNYSISKFKADLCVDSSLYNKIKFHLYYTNNHITDSLLNLGCMKEIVNGSEWEASLVGRSNGVCLNGYTTLNQNISRPIRECLYNGNYGAIIEPCVEIPSNEGFLTGTMKYAVFGISILLLLICLLLLCCCLLCYACDRTKKKHKKRIRNEENIYAEDGGEGEDNNENENDNDNENDKNKDEDEEEDNKENCGTNVIFNDKNEIESIDGLNGSISGGSSNNIKKGILKKTSSKFGKKMSVNSLLNNNNNNKVPINPKKSSATMYSMGTHQLHPSKSSNFINYPNNSNKPLRHFKSSHNVLRSNSKISPSLPGSTSDNMDDDENNNNNKFVSRKKSSTSSGFNPTFSTSNIGLSNPNIPTLGKSSSGFNPTFSTSNIGLSNPNIPTLGKSSSGFNPTFSTSNVGLSNPNIPTLGRSSSGYNPRFTSGTLGLSNPGSVVNSDNESSDNEISLKKSSMNDNNNNKINIPPKYVMNKRQSIGRSASSAFPPPPPPQIQPPPPAGPSSSKTIRHYSVRGSGPSRSVSCRIPKRVNKIETTDNHPFGIGSPIKRSKSTLFRDNKNEMNSGAPVRQLSKKNSSKAMELDLDIEDLI